MVRTSWEGGNDEGTTDSEVRQLRRVQQFLDAFAAKLSAVNASAARKELDMLVAEMGANESEQSTSTLNAKSQTAAQAVLRRDLVKHHMRPVATIAAAHLRDVPGFKALQLPKDGIKVAVLIQDATAMAEAARGYRQVFVDNGRPENFADALLAAAGAVRASIDARAKYIASKAGARDGLKATASRAHLILRVLDAQVESTLMDDAKALAEWRSAKRIGKGIPNRGAVRFLTSNSIKRMPHFIDSHAHLADSAFDPDREDVIRRARDAGARAIVCIGESLATAARAREIAGANRGFVSWTAGIHPHDAASFAPERDLEPLEVLLRSGASAVGECGLDYRYDNSPREAQREAFVAQLDIAQQSKLPVVVHTRDAEDDTRSLLLAAARRGVVGVLHCYTGSRQLATDAVDAGWYISFSGIVTFKNWTDDQLLRMVPDERLLAESDSPYLAPVPNRGKRNEPAWVGLTVARLAAARNTEPDALGVVVAENARRLFALDLASP